ncbi:hypothetical protein [Streptomyces capoamus]|uniref:Uncharacterized protein n=1 Tax=Streptomyces capoamus TaxID=68183 RepID=A0A919F019_9ACTN|nr:hypothetical protein [Streptomyces capoamus]GGW20783.1 hypothetical protein GCM10010501_69390 [Streptomyces libani subsp. rufus]GHG63909.1 hypothetical protein GCM10018980_54770 [Streptomyces capoamus]
MAQALQPNTAGSLFATDGKRHPLQEALMAVTFALGLLSFITSFFHSLHLLTSWTGLVALATGVYGQWVSVTTRQRFFLILGLGAAGIGFLIGMAHGGLFGGIVG